VKKNRSNITKTRFNDEELLILDKAAAKLGVTRAKFMREALIECAEKILPKHETSNGHTDGQG
jgi:uncharacterized protein (DUF1778 family)